MIDTIKAKVVYDTAGPSATVVRPTPATVKGKTTHELTDPANVPYLNERTMVVVPEAITDLSDVTVLAQQEGAVLFWEDTEAKFVIQRYSPAKVGNVGLDGGTF